MSNQLRRITSIRIPINEVKISPGRRKADPAHINELSQSIADVGLLNPITVNSSHTLIAGLHPEAIAWNRPGHVNNHQSSSDNLTLEPKVKSFVEDTAEKLGVSTRTVERRLWMAKHLTPKAMDTLAARFTEAR